MDDTLKVYFPYANTPAPPKFIVAGTVAGNNIKGIQGQIARIDETSVRGTAKAISGKTLFFINEAEISKDQSRSPQVYLWAIYFTPGEAGIYQLDIVGIGQEGKQASKIAHSISEFEVHNPDQSSTTAMFFAGGVAIMYPTANYTLSTSERSYFIVAGTSNRPMLSVEVWKSLGVLNQSASYISPVDGDGLWSATFSALDTGSNQTLRAMNVDNNSDSLQISI